MCPGSQRLRQHGVSVVNELQWLRWHRWNYFPLKKVKTNKKCNFIFSKIACQSSRWLCGHINDFVDTFWKLWRLLTDFKGTIRQKKYLGLFTHPIAIIKKFEKLLYLKKHLGVNDYADSDTGFLNFAIKYLPENKKFAKPFLPVYMGPRWNLFSQKKVKNLVTLFA